MIAEYSDSCLNLGFDCIVDHRVAASCAMECPEDYAIVVVKVAVDETPASRIASSVDDAVVVVVVMDILVILVVVVAVVAVVVAAVVVVVTAVEDEMVYEK